MNPASERGKVVVDMPVESLADLDMAFSFEEGFSRPDWKSITEFVRQHVPRYEWSAAWDYLTFKWLETLARDLGGESRIHTAKDFYCLTDLNDSTTATLLSYAASAVDMIRRCLGSAAWNDFYGKHVLLIFSDPDDYFAYISYFHDEGSHMLSGGSFIRSGYAHIAIPFHDTITAQHTLVHELAHNLVCHLPIPIWLNEGLAQIIERQLTRKGFLVTRELASRHYSYWNEQNIQLFWSGKTFDLPGAGSQLSYSLGEILVTVLLEKGPAFAEFVKTADWRDAGQDAAINFLGQGLEEVMGGFLGPGNWRPQRKAIKESLKVAK